jgi:hypothetical protein
MDETQKRRERMNKFIPGIPFAGSDLIGKSLTNSSF